jgi:hypothetical protein
MKRANDCGKTTKNPISIWLLGGSKKDGVLKDRTSFLFVSLSKPKKTRPSCQGGGEVRHHQSIPCLLLDEGIKALHTRP